MIIRFLKNLVNADGSWNLDMFRIWIPGKTINCIVSIPLPQPSSGPNRIGWMSTSTGSFSVNSAYRRKNERSWDPKDASRSISWKYKGTQRVKFFIWLAFKQKLLTNMKQVRRGIGNGSLCAICGHDSKDILHAIRDCSGAKEVWNQLNFDGAVKIDSGKTASGGVLRDWEVWKQQKLFMIVLSSLNSTLIRHIGRMLEVGNWFLQYIPRENNKDVDCIAKMAFDREEELVEDPPRGIPRALKLM
ncbi:hypothetical protein Goshw_022016 [Gossypium schwendimanii]|uniref:Reverse transcriptase zinc-binding domain-containing protein n=1 Tax=Gossypium schwendimanii TaxID=34291 RepID=A0A7J9LHG3_GOSSC|nr:hypothetical protein [Gossypium schwendimanii]